ncbi:DUF3986 family protein [Alkalihalobacillus pseudalcaliphilus]|uniref:DUF3986 family protein n=1 Tax=Alkalihalobacillus pseudalcaliphilus TaxID=79884 RepID=UPI00064DD13C|nr:DUF3986 family protein [Alkalihalobacillus pseudalcaliphilus]KMK76013.1 hypothetical protein AB990_12320 [Alkalihalobacillus pseudalcaliphilus]
MLFDEQFHQHVGYYEHDLDLEGILLKVLDKDMWCLFFDFDFYDQEFRNKNQYPFYQDFGYLVGIYDFSTRMLTEESGHTLFINFLTSVSLIHE